MEVQIETQTLDELRKAPHLSYSAIRSYLICPMKFWHNYQAKTEPSHRPLALVLGSAIHESLAAYYAHVQGTGMKISPEELLSVFRDRMDAELDRSVPIKLPDDDDGTAMVDQGIDLLRMFWEQSDTPRVLAVEQPFAVPLYDPTTGEQFDFPLIGAMDLIIEDRGKPVVIEHKTAAKRYAQWQLDFEMQPSVYAYACEQIGFGKASLVYQMLIKSKKPALQLCKIKRNEKQVREMMETFSAIVKAIDSGNFWRNRSWACADCQYRYKCDEGA